MSPDKKKRLNILRKKLDNLDNKLIKLIKKRTNIVSDVLKLKTRKDEIVDKQIIPITKKGIKIISMGNIMNYEDAAVWRGPMLSGAIKKLVHDTKWGELDYLLIDMPPGTGDVYLTIFSELSIDEFILITTPNILANSDLQKTITMLKKLNIKIFGYTAN